MSSIFHSIFPFTAPPKPKPKTVGDTLTPEEQANIAAMSAPTMAPGIASSAAAAYNTPADVPTGIQSSGGDFASPADKPQTFVNGGNWQQGSRSGNGNTLIDAMKSAPQDVRASMLGYMHANPDQSWKTASPVNPSGATPGTMSADEMMARINAPSGRSVDFGMFNPQGTAQIMAADAADRNTAAQALAQYGPEGAAKLMAAQGALLTGQAHKDAVGANDEKEVEREYRDLEKTYLGLYGGDTTKASAKAISEIQNRHQQSKFASGLKAPGSAAGQSPFAPNIEAAFLSQLGAITPETIRSTLGNMGDQLKTSPGGLPFLLRSLKQQGMLPNEKLFGLEKELLGRKRYVNQPLDQGSIKFALNPGGFDVKYPTGESSGHQLSSTNQYPSYQPGRSLVGMRVPNSQVLGDIGALEQFLLAASGK